MQAIVRSMKRHVVKTILLRTTALTLVAFLLIAAYLWLTTDLPSPEHLRARAAVGSTRILDRRGRLLYTLPDPLSGQRQPVPLGDVPLALRQATIAVEDADFYQHAGIDIKGLVRAAWTDLRSGAVVAGGSTITQQLARGFLLDPQLAQQRTLERKLRETVLALKLTAAYPKDEILALYLNQTYYGDMAYGVEAAAQHYFGKPVRDLDLAESALLAGLPQAPSRLNPLEDARAREAARVRQAAVLDAMVRADFIAPAQATQAKAEPLQFASERTTMRAPHFVHYVLDLLTAQLGPDAVARGGLTVTTTLDIDLQDAAQASLQRQITLLSTPQAGAPDHRVRNGAVVVLDPSDGAILTMVGSPNFDDVSSDGQVNGALALRQPGSAIKPLTYAAALEHGWTPATTLLDIPSSFPTREGRPYTPANYDRTYRGPLSLREALATSSNIAAVRTLDAIGVPALLEMASRLGITTLGEDSGHYGLALTLGGGEVTLLQLTGAYAAFADNGERVTPYAIVAVREANDKVTRWQGDRVIVSIGSQRDDGSSVPSSPCHPVTLSPCHPVTLSPQVAYLITDILADRYARMHAFGASSVLDIDRPAAAKTGTTSDWRDNWTVGYSPDRVVGVWVGNADGQPMEDVSGIDGAGPVWHEVMLAAHRGLPPRPFTRPAGIVELPVCAEGGMLPTAACPATRLERFIAGTQPTRPDDTHVAIQIDPTLGCRAPAAYPLEQTVTRIFRLLPPEAESWGASAGVVQVPVEECGKQQTEDRRPETRDNPLTTVNRASSSGSGLPSSVSSLPSLALTSPAPDTQFALSPGVPAERQRIVLEASVGNAASATILVDGAPVASFTSPPYRALWPLTPGTHQATVEARAADGSLRRSEAVTFFVESLQNPSGL